MIKEKGRFQREMVVLLWGGLALFLCQVALAKVPAKTHKAKKTSSIVLDKKKTRVYWSDGDTFEVLGGPLRGAKARLYGFNTLESYGAVHRWGKWQASGLQAIADQATEAVRRGEWRCHSKGKRGRYGRILVACPGLTAKLVRLGLAHVYGAPPKAHASWLTLQRQAQQAKRGMWAKGTPRNILTSVHSFHETKGKRRVYNRLISTHTGVSTKYYHKRLYKSCQWVCLEGACLLYVPYKRRYGARRASCLRK